MSLANNTERTDGRAGEGEDGGSSGSSRSSASEGTDSGGSQVAPDEGAERDGRQDTPEIDYSLELHAGDDPDGDEGTDGVTEAAQPSGDAGDRDQAAASTDADSVFYLRDAAGVDAVRITLATGYNRFETISSEHRYVYEKSPDPSLGGIFCTLHYSEITMDEFFAAADEYFLDPDNHSVVVHQDSINGRDVVWHVVTDGSGEGRLTSYFAWLTDGTRKVSVEYYGPDTAEDPDAVDLMNEEFIQAEFQEGGVTFQVFGITVFRPLGCRHQIKAETGPQFFFTHTRVSL